MTSLPQNLQEAIESGKLTEDQLRELITIEARALGLSYHDAVRMAKQRCLPKTYIGADIELLVELLAA